MSNTLSEVTVMLRKDISLKPTSCFKLGVR